MSQMLWDVQGHPLHQSDDATAAPRLNGAQAGCGGVGDAEGSPNTRTIEL